MNARKAASTTCRGMYTHILFAHARRKADGANSWESALVFICLFHYVQVTVPQ